MITIGLPVYNAEDYIEFAIKSIFAQSFEDWRLIIINDGSTDQSDQLIRPFLRDERVKYMKLENKGLITRLNELTRLTTTPYYARMDADDVMHPDRLRLQVEFLEAHPDVDVVGSDVISINENNDIVGLEIAGRTFTTRDVLFRNPLIHPSLMGKTSWFKKYPYDERFRRAEDKELWIRTHRASSFYNIPEPLLFYREGKVSIPNYISTHRTLMKIYHEYRYLFPNDKAYYLLLMKSKMKLLAYQIFGLFNLQNILVNTRSTKLTDLQKETYEKVIEEIKE